MTQPDEQTSPPAVHHEAAGLDELARAARKRWVRSMVASVAERPRYGSREWLALPEGDRRKVAAVVVAAECWASNIEDFPQQLEAELAAYRAAEDAYYAALHAQVYEEVVKPLTKPNGYRSKTLAERLERARTPRPGDRPPHAGSTDSQQTDRPGSGDAA